MSRLRYLLPLLLAACASPGPGDPPVDLAALAPIVAELQLAESVAQETPQLVQDSMRKRYFLTVLEANGLTEESFNEQMWIVRQEPVWIDSLYTRVGDIISREIAEYGALPK